LGFCAERLKTVTSWEDLGAELSVKEKKAVKKALDQFIKELQHE
jgi:hypothetical protein